jgi:hypothetical protein
MRSRCSQAPAHIASQADARSVQLRSSDVSCAILPRLGASDAAPAPPIALPARTAAPRLAPRRTHHPLQPRAQPPPANSTQHHPCTAGARSQAPAHSAAARRCMQRTAEVQRRQLRHPSEARCQRRRPSSSNPIVCTHRRPSARPSRNPPPATASHATAPAQSTQHHPCTAGGRTRPQRKPSRCTQRTTEVQRRQLRHPSETRCQRRCSSSSDPIPILSRVTACPHHRPSARPSQKSHHPLQPRSQRP